VVLAAGALEAAAGVVLAAGALEAAAGDTLAVGALEAAGEVDVVVLDVPQPAKAATSIIEAKITAIVFFMGFPPNIEIIFLGNIYHVPQVVLILTLRQAYVKGKHMKFNKYLINI